MDSLKSKFKKAEEVLSLDVAVLFPNEELERRQMDILIVNKKQLHQLLVKAVAEFDYLAQNPDKNEYLGQIDDTMRWEWLDHFNSLTHLRRVVMTFLTHMESLYSELFAINLRKFDGFLACFYLCST